MAFTILDNDEVFNPNQAIWMQTDINALAAGIGGDGVVSGCAVTAQGSPDMTVAVAVGVVRVAGVYAAVTAGNVTIATADGTNPRIDLIVASNAGAKSCTAGTAAASPKAPDIPASSVLLAMVYVPASDTTIASNQITDKRAIVVSLPFAPGRPKTGATVYFGIPGIRWHEVTALGLVNNRDEYTPFEVIGTPITITSMAIEVSAAGAGGTTARLGLYNCDADLQPTSLVLDAGTVAVDSTGKKEITGLTTVLQPGRYLSAITSDASPTVRRWKTGSWSAPVALGSGAGHIYYYNARSFAAFPSTGTVWNNTGGGSSGLHHALVYTWTPG